jgi:hypothetical protein
MPSWMRLLLLAFVLAIALPVAAEPYPVPPAPGTAETASGAPAADGSDAVRGAAGTVNDSPDEFVPSAGSVQYVEIDNRPARPSGFWTSTRPAQGGAYRYRLLGIGVAVMLITLGFMLWVIRRKGQRVQPAE